MGFAGSSGTGRPRGRLPSSRHSHTTEVASAVGKGVSDRRCGSWVFATALRGLGHLQAGAGPRGFRRPGRALTREDVRARPS
jgi:hypothetical protein